MIWFRLHIAWSSVYKGQGTTPDKSIWDIIREEKRHLKNGICICMLHVLYRRAHMSHASTCAHVRMCTHMKIQKDHYPHPNDEARKEETPNMHLGYKLGAVSITMYINSHTSF